MIAHSRLVDPYGEPLRSSKKQAAELAALRALTPSVPVRGKYDAAQTTDDNKNYWAQADSNLDADTANTQDVRWILIKRSRYEAANNGYYAGIAKTYATDLIGTGPKLRMLSGSDGFNRMVETAFARWAQAVRLRQKLWTMAHAKYVDGESFGVLRMNRRLKSDIMLDVCLYEAEQCHTPFVQPWTPGVIDGLQFDEFGNPVAYDFLKYHPGGQHGEPYEYIPESVPAEYVLHWFRQSRPGQHRGVPEATSTLNCGAAARRFREAVLAAAESAASFNILLKTMFQPDEMDAVSPMSTLEIEKRMMTALPQGWEGQQMRAEHPNSTYSEFMQSHISEMARPASMPRNKAACDSSDYNYASGRLDHQTYYAGLDVDRADCDENVCDKLFDIWFPLAVARFNWLGGNPDAISPQAMSHRWDWPKHQAADLKAEADADTVRLRSGAKTLSEVYAEKGMDWNDAVETMANDYNKTPEEIKETIHLANFNIANQLASAAYADDAEEAVGDSGSRATEDGDSAVGAGDDD